MRRQQYAYAPWEDPEDQPEYVTDEELEDYVEYVAQQLWRIQANCKAGHPYFWAIEHIYSHFEDRLDEGGVVEWLDDVFEGDVHEFVDWLDQAAAGAEILLRAGKGDYAAPRVCEKPILGYLRRSNRPRHLTEIIGMLAETEDIYLDRARLGSYLSVLQDKGLVRNTICPIRWKPGYSIERGYWWADDQDPQQLCFEL